MAYHWSAAKGSSPGSLVPPAASRLQRKSFRLGLLAGLCLLALVLREGETLPQALAAGPPPLVFSSRQVDIYYQTPEDLQTLARRLGLVQSGPLGRPDLQRLADQLDGMLAEIQRVLKAPPLKPVTLTIRLLPDSFQVKRQQQSLARPPHGQALASPGSLLSFYEPEARTIFISLADVHIGVLAHEMTHFVLCESSAPRPGVAYQESLAQYMEKRFLSGRAHGPLAPSR